MYIDKNICLIQKEDPTMNISPRRRLRALKVHELRQQGRSLRNIGKLLEISHATVLSDLRLVETHWSRITQQSADDFQLEQLAMLQRRVRILLRRDLLREFGDLSPTDFIRLYESHNHELAILLRETRRLADQLHQRADLRDVDLDQDELPPKLGFPEEELTAAQPPAAPAKPGKSRKSQPRESTTRDHGIPKPTKLNHSNHQKPSKTRQIPPPPPPQKKSDQPPNQPLPDLTPEQLFQQAETFLRNQNGNEPHTPIPIPTPSLSK